MRILVVGGAGHIGTAIVRAAARAGYEVCALTYHAHSYQEPLITNVQLNWYDDRAASRFITDKHFDVVVDGLVFDEQQLRRNMDLLREHCGHYVYISSCGVYNQPGENLREDSLIDVAQIHWNLMKKSA